MGTDDMASALADADVAVAVMEEWEKDQEGAIDFAASESPEASAPSEAVGGGGGEGALDDDRGGTEEEAMDEGDEAPSSPSSSSDSDDDDDDNVSSQGDGKGSDSGGGERNADADGNDGDGLSEYERLRLRNIERNNARLARLGLLDLHLSRAPSKRRQRGASSSAGATGSSSSTAPEAHGGSACNDGGASHGGGEGAAEAQPSRRQPRRSVKSSLTYTQLHGIDLRRVRFDSGDGGEQQPRLKRTHGPRRPGRPRKDDYVNPNVCAECGCGPTVRRRVKRRRQRQRRCSSVTMTIENGGDGQMAEDEAEAGEGQESNEMLRTVEKSGDDGETEENGNKKEGEGEATAVAAAVATAEEAAVVKEEEEEKKEEAGVEQESIETLRTAEQSGDVGDAIEGRNEKKEGGGVATTSTASVIAEEAVEKEGGEEQRDEAAGGQESNEAVEKEEGEKKGETVEKQGSNETSKKTERDEDVTEREQDGKEGRIGIKREDDEPSEYYYEEYEEEVEVDDPLVCCAYCDRFYHFHCGMPASAHAPPPPPLPAATATATAAMAGIATTTTITKAPGEGKGIGEGGLSSLSTTTAIATMWAAGRQPAALASSVNVDDGGKADGVENGPTSSSPLPTPSEGPVVPAGTASAINISGTIHSVDDGTMPFMLVFSSDPVQQQQQQQQPMMIDGATNEATEEEEEILQTAMATVLDGLEIEPDNASTKDTGAANDDGHHPPSFVPAPAPVQPPRDDIATEEMIIDEKKECSVAATVALNEPEQGSDVVSADNTGVGKSGLDNLPLPLPASSKANQKSLDSAAANDLQIEREAKAVVEAASDATTNETIAAQSSDSLVLPSMGATAVTVPSAFNDRTKPFKCYDCDRLRRRRRRRKACGTCGPCTRRDDCGTCVYCVDKPEFGGPHKLRRRCIMRRCVVLAGGAGTAAASIPTSPMTKGAVETSSSSPPMTLTSAEEGGVGSSSGIGTDAKEEGDAGKDTNDEFCFVCRDGGDLFCCDGCNKSYHSACHRPVLYSVPTGRWFCMECRRSDRRERELERWRRASRMYRIKQERLRSDPSLLWATVGDREVKCRVTGPADPCAICNNQEKNELKCTGEHEKAAVQNNEGMIRCHSCEKSFHLGCHSPPLEAYPPNRYRWRCIDCRGPRKGFQPCRESGPCCACGKVNGDSVHCKLCGKTYHLGCHSPPLDSFPTYMYRWKCSDCREMRREYNPVLAAIVGGQEVKCKVTGPAACCVVCNRGVAPEPKPTLQAMACSQDVPDDPESLVGQQEAGTGDAGTREMIRCSFCDNYYHRCCHLPPLLSRDNGGPRSIWKCSACKEKGRRREAIGTPVPRAPQARDHPPVPNRTLPQARQENLSKKVRCGKCEACLREDCGQCRNCLDKPKFGGTHKRRQGCELRECTSPDTIAIKPPRLRVEGRCGECEGCIRPDCGKCRNCLDKPKFGGPHKRRQACELRECTYHVVDVIDPAITSQMPSRENLSESRSERPANTLRTLTSEFTRKRRRECDGESLCRENLLITNATSEEETLDAGGVRPTEKSQIVSPKRPKEEAEEKPSAKKTRAGTGATQQKRPRQSGGSSSIKEIRKKTTKLSQKQPSEVVEKRSTKKNDSGTNDPISNKIRKILRVAHAEPKNSKVQDLACEHLRKIAKNVDVARKIVDLGGIEMMSKALRDHPDKTIVQAEAFATLAELVWIDSSIGSEVAAQGCIGLLTRALEHHGCHPKVQQMGCGALRALSYDSSSIQLIKDAGGVDVVLESMKRNSKKTDVLKEGSYFLQNMICASPDTVNAVIKSKRGNSSSAIVPVLIRAMVSNPGNAELQGSICGLLANVCATTNDNGKYMVAEAGAVPILVAVLESCRVMEVKQAACSALKHLVTNNSRNKQFLIEAGAAKAALSSMKLYSEDPVLFVAACGLVKELASFSRVAEDKIVEEDGLRLIVSAMSEHTNFEPLQLAGCSALGSFHHVDSNLSVEAVRVVLAAIKSYPDEKNLLEEACGALLALSEVHAVGPILRRRATQKLLSKAMNKHSSSCGPVIDSILDKI